MSQAPGSGFLPAFEDALLPDDSMEVVKVQGRKIALARRHGKLYAFDNECPHVGGSLGHGSFQGESVVCPLHQMTFDLATGQATKGIGELRIIIHETMVLDGKIWVRFGS